jgi:cytochrome c553
MTKQTIVRTLIFMTLTTSSALASEPDLENGADINETCAACHGDMGQGGKQGEYPRLAGLSPAYIAKQLRAFRDRARVNIPMIPFTEPRELPDRDIEDVAAYLSTISLPNQMPDFKETDDSLTRLQLAAKVMQVPLAEGNVETGAKLYKMDCRSCHGSDGGGKDSGPSLRGQYTKYLERQMKLFIKGDRLHEEETPGPGLVNEFSEGELRDILAYISTLDD